jgi:hypothetical protein
MPAGHLKKHKHKHKQDASAETAQPSVSQASKALADEDLHPKLGLSSADDLELKVRSPRASVVSSQSATSTRLPSLWSPCAPEQPQPASRASARSNFIEKKDAQSGRSYWVNLANKTTSWEPPDGWNSSAEYPLARTSDVNVSAGQAANAVPDAAGTAEARESSPPPPPPPPPALRDVARHKELVPVRASAAASATPRHSERASKSPPAQHPVHLVSSSTRIFIQQQPKQQHLNDWVQHHEQPPLKHIETEQKQEARLERSRASVSRATKASADEELPPPPAAAAPEQLLAAPSMPADHLKKHKHKQKNKHKQDVSSAAWA